MAGFAIRSRSAGHPGRGVKTHHAPRLKPDHSIGAGHVRSHSAQKKHLARLRSILLCEFLQRLMHLCLVV